MRPPAALAALALVAVACSGGDGLPAPPADGFDAPVTVTFEGAPPLRAEVARTPEQRARGLMQRTELPDGTGMIFLFPRRTNVGFWMKGTLVPLSIAYVDGDRVVSTAEMVPCRTDPCRDYPPTSSYTAAVEAPSGFFPSHGVVPGTRMTVTGPTAPPR
ncbi:MAG TPA: DUF192 domain-containing protein [Mycobacteriales bacterium]